jgi:hypothetical protein
VANYPAAAGGTESGGSWRPSTLLELVGCEDLLAEALRGLPDVGSAESAIPDREEVASLAVFEVVQLFDEIAAVVGADVLRATIVDLVGHLVRSLNVQSRHRSKTTPTREGQGRRGPLQPAPARSLIGLGRPSMGTENCKHENAAPKELLEKLPHSQAGEGRHRCAVCAYAEGLRAGREQALREAREGGR